ncbi:MAG: peptide ABC transporter substrate-binding protein, partial [Verrucomicrobia bacterium]|nr:peptide ABC transporter substrate-binding protein [Verrucomicrobiota bacterium]
ITFSNEEFDKLVTAADNESDTAKRADLYSQAQKLLIEQAPVAFLYNDGGKQLVKSYVTGVKETPLDYIPGFFNLKELDVAP